MEVQFYDDASPEAQVPCSVFLAGPTARGVPRTPWRVRALSWLAARDFPGTVFVPEFRDGRFEEQAPARFSSRPSPVPGVRDISYGVLGWETAAIEQAAVVLFWMPFHLAQRDDPASLPGFTTRAEVSREMARDPSRIVLGMPARGVLVSGHIRYHAHRSGLSIAPTLEKTLEAALDKLGLL